MTDIELNKMLKEWDKKIKPKKNPNIKKEIMKKIKEAEFEKF